MGAAMPADRPKAQQSPITRDIAIRAETFLTERDLAERWRMSPKTLQNWRVIGRGPQFWKLGNCVRYRVADILEFEEAGSPRSSTSE